MDPKAAIIEEILRLLVGFTNSILPYFPTHQPLAQTANLCRHLDSIVGEEILEGLVVVPNRFYGRLSSISDSIVNEMHDRGYLKLSQHAAKLLYHAVGLAHSLQYLP